MPLLTRGDERLKLSRGEALQSQPDRQVVGGDKDAGLLLVAAQLLGRSEAPVEAGNPACGFQAGKRRDGGEKVVRGSQQNGVEGALGRLLVRQEDFNALIPARPVEIIVHQVGKKLVIEVSHPGHEH